VGNVAAPLWTGAAATFTIEATDLTLVVVTVTDLVGENVRATPP
jgi:hypothetical protein